VTEIVNLRLVRKQKERAAARAKGHEAAALSGRSKIQKAQEKAIADKTARDLDGHLRDRPSDSE
jgi:hypothetical protein